MWPLLPLRKLPKLLVVGLLVAAWPHLGAVDLTAARAAARIDAPFSFGVSR